MDEVELRIASLLDAADVEQARVRAAIDELKATGPVLQQAIAVAVAVKQAFSGLQQDIERVRGTMKWFSYRWIVIAGGTLLGLAAVGFFVTWIALKWQRHEVDELVQERTALEAQKQELEGETAQLQTNLAALAKKGARIKLSDCAGRLCVEVNPNQSEAVTHWKGPWNNSTSGRSYVIPQGY